jgi:branched-chain amino acid transport system substrate-binding protein
MLAERARWGDPRSEHSRDVTVERDERFARQETRDEVCRSSMWVCWGEAMRFRMVALVTVMVVASAACGNSQSQTAATTTEVAAATVATVNQASLHEFRPVTAKGVTDKQISVDVIASKTNPLHGHYAEIADGVQAYFNMVNSEGGLYGRKLVIGSQRDDIVGLENRQQVQQALATDNAFATFVATLQFTGADLLQAAGQPTFGWNINAEFGDKNALFGNESALCNGQSCALPIGPWLAQKAGAKNVGVLAYGVNQASIACGQGTVASFVRYPTAKVAFQDLSLGFADPDLSAQVAQMKAKGVQMVFTCMDSDETLVLAKEMKKQGLDAIQELPNGYDHAFIKANANYFEGSYVIPQFTALEWQPQLPEIKLFEKWVAAENKPIYEITVIGWIAAYQFVLGLELAGPDFSQQKMINALNTQTAVTVNGMIPKINWTTGHIDPVKHPEARDPINCANFLVIHNGTFVPTFATADKPYICLDARQTTLPDNPPTRSFSNG